MDSQCSRDLLGYIETEHSGFMTDWLAIVNRRAGTLRSPARLQAVLSCVRPHARKTVFTEYPGHAREIASQAAAYPGIIVVGGDGTLLEVLNGFDSTTQRLAILPSGRGNSLARDLGLYPLEAAVQAIQSGRSSRIDLMEATFENTQQANGRRAHSLSASTIALGYPTAVVRAAGARFRPMGTYCYAAAAAFLRPASREVQISEEGCGFTAKHLTGLVANNTRHLANFVALPDACCHDGHFDVMEMSSGFLHQILHNLSALSGLQFYSPVAPRPMTSLNILLKRPEELMIDGELFGNVSSVNVRMRAAAVELIQQGFHGSFQS
jgi:diacylglycerol kinase family enzyme